LHLRKSYGGTQLREGAVKKVNKVPQASREDLHGLAGKSRQKIKQFRPCKLAFRYPAYGGISRSIRFCPEGIPLEPGRRTIFTKTGIF
jgi:hypothetical protein